MRTIMQVGSGFVALALVLGVASSPAGAATTPCTPTSCFVDADAGDAGFDVHGSRETNGDLPGGHHSGRNLGTAVIRAWAPACPGNGPDDPSRSCAAAVKSCPAPAMRYW